MTKVSGHDRGSHRTHEHDCASTEQHCGGPYSASVRGGHWGWAVDALIGLLVVVTVRATRRGRPRRLRRAVPLTVLWTAPGAWTAWAAYGLVLGTVPNDLLDHTTSWSDLVLYASKIVAGASLLLTVRRLAIDVS